MRQLVHVGSGDTGRHGGWHVAQMMMRSVLSMDISQAVSSALLKAHVKCSKFIKQQNCILTKLNIDYKREWHRQFAEGCYYSHGQ